MNKTKLLPAMLTFAEVVKSGSFTAAGRGLGLSKSAVSQQLARLELAVGAQLIKRNTRGLSVTAVGQRLLARCDLLQDQVDQALANIDEVIALIKASASPADAKTGQQGAHIEAEIVQPHQHRHDDDDDICRI